MSRIMHVHPADRARVETQRREHSREATLHKLHEDAVLLANEGSHERVDHKRRQRLAAEQQREHDLLVSIESKRLADEARRVQEEQEARLAQELERLKHDQEVGERRRQQLREANVELRELEQKLKLAYLNKEIHAQKAEKEYAARTEREAQVLVEQELNAQRLREEEEERRRQEQTVLANRQYKKELQQQLGEQEAQQRAAYEQFLREKMMIDEIVRKIYAEDQRAQELEQARKAQTRREMEDFKRQQELWRQAEQQRMAQENEDIARYATAQTQREQQQRAGFCPVL